MKGSVNSQSVRTLLSAVGQATVRQATMFVGMSKNVFRGNQLTNDQAGMFMYLYVGAWVTAGAFIAGDAAYHHGSAVVQERKALSTPPDTSGHKLKKT